MDYVKFRDKGFEAVVRSLLNKHRFTSDDLLEVTGILISDRDGNCIGVPWESDCSMHNMLYPNLIYNVTNSEGEAWIEDLVYFKHIETLHIYIGSSENLSFIRCFDKLSELYISNSKVKDWSFLANLISLRFLYISNSTFSDL